MDKKSENYIYGRNPVLEAIKSNCVISFVLSETLKDKDVLKAVESTHLPVRKVTANELNKLCPGVNQGIAAIIKSYEYHSLEEIIHRSKKESNPIIVMLDGINDPHNFGAILRCCDIFGVAGVIIGRHNQVPLNATVAKTSAGAINFVPVAIVNNLNNAIKTLKESGFWIVSSSGSANTNCQDLKYDFPVVLVIGNEGDGVSQLVLKNSDYIVKIPMYGKVNSLNASVATGILLSRIKG